MKLQSVEEFFHKRETVEKYNVDKIIKLNTVKDYNDFLGIETPHPLVSVIDASKISPLRHVRKNIGFYVVYLKDIQCADQIKYGRN